MEKKTGLELLRKPFLENQISKLPKGTKAQNNCPVNEKIRCKVCGGFHHPKIVHLDYVGHAALTDRLLDADPLWTWEPLAYDEKGLPLFDVSGGLWIKLTVCGHARMGYGHAESSQYKEIGSREKEVIGDALRNAAMRFGSALDLWHKGKLHIEEDPETTDSIIQDYQKKIAILKDPAEFDSLLAGLVHVTDQAAVKVIKLSIKNQGVKLGIVYNVETKKFVFATEKSNLSFLLTELGKIETKELLIKFEKAFDPQISGLNEKDKIIYDSASADQMAIILDKETLK